MNNTLNMKKAKQGILNTQQLYIQKIFPNREKLLRDYHFFLARNNINTYLKAIKTPCFLKWQKKMPYMKNEWISLFQCKVISHFWI